MDIEEFLDRELSELGFESERAEEQIDIPGLSEEHSSLFESIHHSLSRGDIAKAEQQYSQLWQALANQKFKWDKELHSQLLSLSKQFSAYLSQAYGDLKRKAMYINGMLGRGRMLVKEGKNGMVLKVYSEMQSVFNSIPNAFLEEKAEIGEQIGNFYKEIKKITDREAAAKVSGLINEISQLIAKINAAIKANDFASASSDYSRCIQLYNQIPEGFLLQKNFIGMKILEIYRSISIYNEISELQKQLNQHK